MKKLISIFTAVIIALVIIIYYLLTFEETPGKWQTFGIDLAKIAAQMLLVAILGGALIGEFNRRRTRKEALNEFRKTVLRELNRAYTDTKKSRRHLRAKRCVEPNSEDTISRAAYVEEMQNIIDIELRIEVIKLELKIFKDVFTEYEKVIDKHGKEKHQLKIVAQLKTMEDYLHDNLINEYETVLSENGNLDPIPLSKLPQLAKFIEKASDKQDSKFEEIFRNTFKKSLQIIENESLKV